MRVVLTTLLLLGFLACTNSNSDQMFSSNVIEVSNSEIQNLRAGKVGCLHCPMYFSFDAKPPVLKRVIDLHHLKRVDSLPAEGRQSEELVARAATWWQSADSKAGDQIYWAHYSAKVSGLDPAFRLLVIKNGRVFFITSGHFSEELYEEDNA